MAKAELFGILQKASYGFSGETGKQIYTVKPIPTSGFVNLLYKICEKLSLNNYSILKRSLLSFTGLLHTYFKVEKYYRINPDVIFFAPGEVAGGANALWTILHPVSGTRILMSETELNHLLSLHSSKKEFSPNSSELSLIENGILLPKGSYSEVKSSSDRSGLNIWLNLGYECPNGCGFCFASSPTNQLGGPHDRYDKVGEFNIEHMDELAIGIVKSLKKLGSNKVTLKFGGGGEPIVYFEKLTETVAKCRELMPTVEFNFVVITSGIGLTENMCRYFHDFDIYVALALGGDEVGHWLSRPFVNGTNSWTQVMKSLKMILDNNVKYNLSFVLSEKNIKSFVGKDIAQYDTYSNIFYLFDIVFRQHIRMDFSFARPSSGEPTPIKYTEEFSTDLRVLLRAYMQYQRYWTENSGPLKMDYTAIGEHGSGKQETCFAGRSYVSVTSLKYDQEIRNKNKYVSMFLAYFQKRRYAKLSIGACHEIAESGGLFDSFSKLSMLEQANLNFSMKEGKYKKRPALSPELARKTCMGCALRYYCSGLDEVGGCVIQRSKLTGNSTEVNKPEYCGIYATAIESMLTQGLCRSNLLELTLPKVKKQPKDKLHFDKDKKYRFLLANFSYSIFELEKFRIQSMNEFARHREDATELISFINFLNSVQDTAHKYFTQIEMWNMLPLSEFLADFWIIHRTLPKEFSYLIDILSKFDHVDDSIENKYDTFVNEIYNRLSWSLYKSTSIGFIDWIDDLLVFANFMKQNTAKIKAMDELLFRGYKPQQNKPINIQLEL